MEMLKRIAMQTRVFAPMVTSVQSMSSCVQYPYGIKYYPRNPEEKDPEITPSKLFRVERIKGIKYTTKIERFFLRGFNLHHHHKRNVSVVKNTPENNGRLWQIKHLVEIKPITFPYGEPTENDLKHTVLKENGECLVTKELFIPNERLEAREVHMQNPAKMTNQTIEKHCRKKWLSGFDGGY